MRSIWYKLKPEAIKLRKCGYSIRNIEHRLKIPRSTLSFWLKNIELSQKQKVKLIKDWKNGLVKARKKAVLWHNTQKEKRLQEAKDAALKTLEYINIDDKKILELALSLLYLGEGRKNQPETAIGSSNPLILNFFLTAIKNLYIIDIKKIKCELSLRADQSPKQMKRFWSKALKLPLDNFKQISVDKRTIGSKTYSYYKGVCQIRCANVSIQRKLLYLANLFCQKIVDKNMGA